MLRLTNTTKIAPLFYMVAAFPGLTLGKSQSQGDAFASGYQLIKINDKFRDSFVQERPKATDDGLCSGYQAGGGQANLFVPCKNAAADAVTHR